MVRPNPNPRAAIPNQDPNRAPMPRANLDPIRHPNRDPIRRHPNPIHRANLRARQKPG